MAYAGENESGNGGSGIVSGPGSDLPGDARKPAAGAGYAVQVRTAHSRLCGGQTGRPAAAREPGGVRARLWWERFPARNISEARWHRGDLRRHSRPPARRRAGIQGEARAAPVEEE